MRMSVWFSEMWEITLGRIKLRQGFQKEVLGVLFGCSGLQILIVEDFDEVRPCENFIEVGSRLSTPKVWMKRLLKRPIILAQCTCIDFESMASMVPALRFRRFGLGALGDRRGSAVEVSSIFKPFPSFWVRKNIDLGPCPHGHVVLRPFNVDNAKLIPWWIVAFGGWFGSFMFISSPKWKEYGKIIQQKLAFLRPLHWQERMPPAHMRPGSSSSDIQKLGRGLLQALDHWRDGINFFAFEMCKYITPFIVSQSYSFHLELPSLLLSPIRHFSPISPANRRIDMRTKTSQVSEIHVRHIQNTFEMRMTLTQMNTHTHTQTLKMCSTF